MSATDMTFSVEKSSPTQMLARRSKISRHCHISLASSEKGFVSVWLTPRGYLTLSRTAAGLSREHTSPLALSLGAQLQNSTSIPKSTQTNTASNLKDGWRKISLLTPANPSLHLGLARELVSRAIWRRSSCLWQRRRWLRGMC